MIARIVYLRWWILAAWVALAAALLFLAPPFNAAISEPASLLPSSAPSRQAITELAQSFPDQAGYSQAAIVIARPGAVLTRHDLDLVEQIASGISTAARHSQPGEPLHGLSVLSPAMIPPPSNPLISAATERGQAALVRVSVPASFLNSQALTVVHYIRQLLESAHLPPDLRVAVTGSAAFGDDYVQAVEESHRRSVVATLTAVVVILALIYRAPWPRCCPW